MTYQLEDLLTQISSPISLVIHVGAGKGAELALYDSMRVKQLVCIEPIPRLAEQLTALSADCQHTEVMVENRAISTKVALLDFYETNNTAFSGFQKPYLWRKYFSDLKLEHEYPIDTWTLAQVVETYVNPRANNLLVLDVPIASAELLSGLSESDAAAFRWIMGAAYESDDNTWQGIQKHLGALTGTSVRFPSAPPFCLFYAERTPEKAKVKSLEKAAEQQRERIEENELQLSQAQALLEGEQAKSEELLSSSRAQQDKQQAKLEATQQELSELKQESEAIRQELTAEKEQLEQILPELTDTRGQLTDAHDQLTDAQGQLTDAQRELADTGQRLDEASQALTQQQETADKERADFTRKIEQLTTDLAAAESAHEDARKELTDNLETLQQQVETLQQERDKLAHDLAGVVEESEAKSKQLSSYQATEDEQQHRQDLLDQEVSKFGAQLTLITDVLLRERLKR